MAAVPATALTFVTMDRTRAAISQRSPEMSHVTASMYAGAVAGGVRLTIFVPFDLLKTRA